MTTEQDSPPVPTSGESGLETPRHGEENANVALISIPRVHGIKINATVSGRGGGEGEEKTYCGVRIEVLLTTGRWVSRLDFREYYTNIIKPIIV